MLQIWWEHVINKISDRNKKTKFRKEEDDSGTREWKQKFGDGSKTYEEEGGEKQIKTSAIHTWAKTADKSKGKKKENRSRTEDEKTNWLDRQRWDLWSSAEFVVAERIKRWNWQSQVPEMAPKSASDEQETNQE